MSQVDKEPLSMTGSAVLYDKYAPMIFRSIYQQLPYRQDAEDVLLEVFLAALKQDNLATLAPEQQLAWLQRVARNKVIDRYRQHTHMIMLPLDTALEMVDWAPTPEQQALQREAYERLYKELERLPAVQQQLIHLRFGNNLRFQQIAAILNRPEGSVRKMLSRTLKQLRAIYIQK